MKAVFNIEKPDEISATLTLTMKLSEWKALQDQLARSWPAWKLSHAISDLVSAATKHFGTTIEGQ